ncbi:MAG: hypothetical protein IJX62_07990 [Clostridia bacterium]|nr:hypothetical protein [Clostridia bacterium]
MTSLLLVKLKFQSFDFLTGTFKKKTGTEILLGIEYSVDVDDYNSISASMTINYDQTMSVEYQINTNYNDGYSLATTMGIKTNKNNTPPPSTVTVPDRVTEKEEAPSFLEKTGELLEEIGDGIDAIGQGLANYSEEHPFWGALAYVAVTVVGIAVVGGVIVAPFP